MEISSIKDLRYNKAVKDLMKKDINGTWNKIEFKFNNKIEAYNELVEALKYWIVKTKDNPEEQKFYKTVLRKL